MNASQALVQIVVPMLLLCGIVAGVAVRGVGAVCSRRVRESVRRHPLVHALWLVGSLVAVLILVSWLLPHFSNRPAPEAKHTMQRTVVVGPAYALL